MAAILDPYDRSTCDLLDIYLRPAAMNRASKKGRSHGGRSSAAAIDIDATTRRGSANKYVFARPPRPLSTPTRPNSTRWSVADAGGPHRTHTTILSQAQFVHTRDAHAADLRWRALRRHRDHLADRSDARAPQASTVVASADHARMCDHCAAPAVRPLHGNPHHRRAAPRGSERTDERGTDFIGRELAVDHNRRSSTFDACPLAAT